MKKIIFILITLISFPALADVNIIVPFAAGGSFDIMARKFAKFVTEKTGESAVVLNVPGAGGYLGLKKLEESSPNTLTLTGSSIYSHLLEKQAPLNTFKYVSVLGETPMFLVATKKSGLTCEKLRDRSGPVFVGSSGKGSMTYAGVAPVFDKYKNFVSVPYNGYSQLLSDLHNNNINLIVVTSLTLKQPDMVFLANSSNKALYDTPSMNSCLGTQQDIQSQFLIVTNSKTGERFIQDMNQLANEFVKQPDTIEYFHTQGIAIKTNNVSNTNKQVIQEYSKWKLSNK